MEENYINSIIGPGGLFRGDLEIEGLVRIDGDYLGTIKKAARVLVGANGRAEAQVHARVVVIGGAFNGTIYASERVVLLAGSLVMGAINAPRILVEPGAVLACGLSIHGDFHDEGGAGTSYRPAKKRRTYQRHETAVASGTE